MANATSKPRTATTKKASPAKAAPQTAKAAAPKKTVQATAATKATAPKAAAANAGGVANGELKKKELIEAAAKMSSVKKGDTRKVVDAVLNILGASIRDGRDLNLQPLGKLKQTRAKDIGEARIAVAKIRQKNPSATDTPKS